MDTPASPRHFHNSCLQLLVRFEPIPLLSLLLLSFDSAHIVLVIGIVFYGGYLVRNGEMSSGKLVSFLLYLQSLSDAFSSIGWVFSSLTQAVGAADKVFELLNRKPRYRTPSTPAPAGVTRVSSIRGVDANKTFKYRMSGLRPDGPAQGEIKLDCVDLFYPARPNRQVLEKFSLTIEPGTVVALVGASGGGKSSVSFCR